jgi:hypothetical protein
MVTDSELPHIFHCALSPTPAGNSNAAGKPRKLRISRGANIRIWPACAVLQMRREVRRKEGGASGVKTCSDDLSDLADVHRPWSLRGRTHWLQIDAYAVQYACVNSKQAEIERHTHSHVGSIQRDIGHRSEGGSVEPAAACIVVDFAVCSCKAVTLSIGSAQHGDLSKE